MYMGEVRARIIQSAISNLNVAWLSGVTFRATISRFSFKPITTLTMPEKPILVEFVLGYFSMGI